MTEPALAFQKAMRGRLVADAALTALVPADNIFDRNLRPERYPCIILGDDQVVYSHLYERFFERVTANIHVWTNENGSTAAKTIAGALRTALLDGEWSVDGYQFVNLTIESGRFLRDPDGVHSHGVITVNAIVQELVP